jgi:hypothetical protein
MNINKHQQQGMSGMALMLLIVMLIFALIVFFKLFPVYMENWKVGNVLESISEEYKVYNKKTVPEIKRIILGRLSEEDIDPDEIGLSKENIKDNLTIESISDEKRVEVTLTYERVKPLMGNVSFLVHFENSVKLP